MNLFEQFRKEFTPSRSVTEIRKFSDSQIIKIISQIELFEPKEDRLPLYRKLRQFIVSGNNSLSTIKRVYESSAWYSLECLEFDEFIVATTKLLDSTNADDWVSFSMLLIHAIALGKDGKLPFDKLHENLTIYSKSYWFSQGCLALNCIYDGNLPYFDRLYPLLPNLPETFLEYIRDKIALRTKENLNASYKTFPTDLFLNLTKNK